MALASYLGQRILIYALNSNSQLDHNGPRQTFRKSWPRDMQRNTFRVHPPDGETVNETKNEFLGGQFEYYQLLYRDNQSNLVFFAGNHKQHTLRWCGYVRQPNGIENLNEQLMSRGEGKNSSCTFVKHSVTCFVTYHLHSCRSNRLIDGGEAQAQADVTI